MNRCIALTKVMLKNFSPFHMKRGKSFKTSIKGILLFMVVALSILPIAFGIGSLIYGGYGILSEIQQEGMILAAGFSAVSTAIFFFGIFYVMSIFYFAKDVESLLPLPLKPSEILAAKFATTLAYEYITGLVFLAPVLIGFGAAAGAGLTYYIYSVLLFLTLPVLPLVYASVLSMLMMRFTGLAKNKDRFRIFGGIIAMILAIAVNAVITKYSSVSLSAEELQQLLNQGNNSYVKIISGVFFSNRFAVMALLYNDSLKGLVNMAFFLLICLFAVMLFLSLGEGMYFKGVIGVSETSAKREKYSETEIIRFGRQKSALVAYTAKELKLLFRTPVYFMNCVLVNFLFPFFMAIPILVQPETIQDFRKLEAFIADGGKSAVILSAAFGISVFATSANGITASSISREGTGIFVNKYLPLSYKTQIMAKALSGMSMGAAGVLSMLLGAALLISMPVILILQIIILSILGIIFSSFTGILLDLNFPKLVWDNEQKAVKQNFNVMLNMLVGAVIAGIPVFVCIALRLTILQTFLTIVLLFGMLDILLYIILSRIGVRLFERIEI